MRQSEFLRQFECPAFGYQRIISGKYKIRIIWDLQNGPRRNGEIRQALLTGLTGSKEITPRVLSRELKELATFGLIERKEFKVIPQKVEYSLSSQGQSLIPVISVMNTQACSTL